MLGDNIRIFRKQKGYSQESLAQQLHVVRQTVSKWEKGISVPDAEMLNQISELLEVSVSELLDNTIPEPEEKQTISDVARQLSILNEQLASQTVRRRTILKRIVILIIIVPFVLFVMYMACFCLYKHKVHSSQQLASANLQCTLNGEVYTYEIIYNEHFQIIAAGGDAWISNHVQTEQYDDANILMAQIEDYFSTRGGTCVITDTSNQ